MILYTPIALEQVLHDARAPQIERTEISYDGKMFYIDKHPHGDMTLAQMLSTNPYDYLNQNFQPGKPLN